MQQQLPVPGLSRGSQHPVAPMGSRRPALLVLPAPAQCCWPCRWLRGRGEQCCLPPTHSLFPHQVPPPLHAGVLETWEHRVGWRRARPWGDQVHSGVLQTHHLRSSPGLTHRYSSKGEGVHVQDNSVKCNENQYGSGLPVGRRIEFLRQVAGRC